MEVHVSKQNTVIKDKIFINRMNGFWKVSTKATIYHASLLKLFSHLQLMVTIESFE